MINITDDYAIDADERQYTLVQRKTRTDSKTGDTYEAWETLGYHMTMGDALEALSRRLHREQCKALDLSLAEAIQAYGDIRDTLLGCEGE